MSTSGTLILTVVVATVLLALLAGFIIFMTFLYKQRHDKFQAEKKSLLEAFEKELIQARFEMQNETLKKVAEELHDHIGQLLTVTKLEVGVLELKHPAVADGLARVGDLLGTTLKAARDLSKTLDEDTIGSFGLAESLRLEAERIQAIGTYQVAYSCEGNPVHLPRNGDIVLFRMMQELLANTLKHAEGTRIDLRVCNSPSRLEMHLADNGQGFDISDVENRPADATGSGLRNLKRRAGLLGGNFSLNSTQGTGTQAKIIIPIA